MDQGTTLAVHNLTFDFVDDLAIAAERAIDLHGLAVDGRDGVELGALIELDYLRRANPQIPDLLSAVGGALPATLRRVMNATTTRATYASDRRLGFIKPGSPKNAEAQLYLKHF